MKKLLAGVLALTMLVGTAAFAAESPATKKEAVDNKTAVTADDGSSVTTSSNGTATLKSVKSNKKKVTVDSKVTVGGVNYTVTTIGANAFKSCTKATTITLPKTVKTIKKNAFKGCTKLKTVSLNIKKASAVKVEKGAFKGLKTKKMTVKVNKNTTDKQLKKIKKNLKAAGFNGKVVKSK
jgi:hypothetical protein